VGHLDCAASDGTMLAAFCTRDGASAWLAYNKTAKTYIRDRGVARECYGGSAYDGHVTSKGHNGMSNC
jgi:hypothetical protein